MWSVILLGSVESSRQVVERECPQDLPKPYGKKKRGQLRIPFIIVIIAIFVFQGGKKKKAKLSGKVGEL